MGLHVFFGCYFNLFRLMAKCGVLENLLIKVAVGRGEELKGNQCVCMGSFGLSFQVALSLQ